VCYGQGTTFSAKDDQNDRRNTSRQYVAEEKIRIVMEELRGENIIK
jgi:hypothetical protein